VVAGWRLGGHDVAGYLVYAQQTAANFRAGILLPAWASDLNGGFGGPGLVFYPPLVHALHAVILLAGLPLGTGIGWLSLAAMLLSGLALRGWLRAAGFGAGATWAAVFYAVAPYRLVDLYERGALSEQWGFVFPPLLLWIGAAGQMAPRRRVALASLVLAALVLTNLPLAILFGLVLGPVLLVLPSARRAALPLLVAAPLGLALASFSLGPQAMSSRWLRVELWYGEAGVSAYRPSTNTLFSRAAMDVGFNTRVSTALLATGLVGLAAAAAASRDVRRNAEARTWLCVLAAGFVATLGPLGPLWDAAPVLSKLQFPWRLSAPVTLAASALVAMVPRRRAAALALLGALLAAPFAGTGTAPPSPRPRSPAPEQPGSSFPDARAVHESEGENGSWVQRGMWDYWYVPRTASEAFFVEMTGGRSPLLDPIRSRAALLTTAPETPVEVVRWDRLDKEVSLVAPKPGALLWHVLCFPGTSVAVDGRPAQLLLDRSTGLAAVDVPAGRHIATWRWRPFAPMGSFRWLSGLTLIAVVLLLGLPASTLRLRSRPGLPEREVSPEAPRS
jgi:hypothetical protein